ncbi:phage integrase SAM-like domain-containing protein [Sphingobacterium lactis]|uniref:phage integrase SAM-like domain-containing protein n=1 Tax=Sphingobacterium lactis TaxID=797291 RepID=UPI003EC4DE1A
MATITPKILKKNKYNNNTWRVVYRLTHNRVSRYIKTRRFVTEKDIINQDDISLDYVIDFLADDLKKYRRKIDDIENLESLSVDDILKELTNDQKDIDFIEFCKTHVSRLKDQGRDKTAKPFVTVINSLIDFNGAKLSTSKITSRFLKQYESYLRMPKTITRKQGENTVKKYTSLNDKGLNNHMAAFRTLFNEAKREFNDEDTGRILIKNNPFSVYKIIPKKKKKHKNLSIEQIRGIRDIVPNTTRGKFAKDIFMLSFYMCGMNAVDIFNNWERLKESIDRIGYNRSKTEGMREDDAFISVKIPQEAKNILSGLDMKYKNIDRLNNTLSIGLRSFMKDLKLEELTMLHARHSFATIARNDLNISKEEVAIALNHVSEENRITDTYIAPDWSKIDRVQIAIISKINEDLI